jgi:triosephosphate isomerase
MNPRIPLVAGNWKMNGDLASNTALLDHVGGTVVGERFSAIEVLVCPPFPYLSLAADRLRSGPVAWGAQDVSDQGEGAYTGEVSALMLRDLGCAYAIVGHSERRAMQGETDTVVASKVHRLLDAGICPIICIGESLAQRQSHLTEAVLAHQIDAVVGDAALREIIGADPLGPVARSDLTLAVLGAGLIEFLPLQIENTAAQQIHGFGLVAVLRAFFLHHHRQSGRCMGDADRAFGLVDMLAASPARAHGFDYQILVVNRHIDRFGHPHCLTIKGHERRTGGCCKQDQVRISDHGA